MGRELRLLLAVAAVAVAALIPHGVAAASHHPAGTVPLLFPVMSRSIELDTPAPVRRLIEREQRTMMARAKAAAKLPLTTAAGCISVTDSSRRKALGPPSPDVETRIIGHHVEVLFGYRHMPSSNACRPAFLEVVVFSGAKATSTFNNAGATGTYALVGPRGRIVTDLPWRRHAPFHVLVRAATILGRRSNETEVALACPRSGCLPGYEPAAHSWPLPQPVLPLRGVDHAGLEASLRYVVSGERWPRARGVSCSSLHSCVISLLDPAYPRSPYRVRYQIAGEQMSGCWMAMQRGALDRLPYKDAGRGPLELAGCLSWLH